MVQLVTTKIHISLQITLPHELLERHLATSVEVVGEALTEQVIASVKKNNIGYFPALDYFQQQGDIEDELIEVAETISWFAAKIAREEVQRKLRAYFSSISFQSVQCTSYSIPPVRPNQLNAYQALLAHYTPDTVKLDIVASVLKKHHRPEGMANWAKQLFRRNLENSFEKFEITQTVVM
ncbi:MAG: hypothetical protein OQL06_01255 [Gammaproteobacteria bacterium]|nr:hypothetical protein [Gammaproteobacteria bacterium]